MLGSEGSLDVTYKRVTSTSKHQDVWLRQEERAIAESDFNRSNMFRFQR